MSEDLVVLREILQRELETINAYEKMLPRLADPSLRTIVAHVTDEEREHVAEMYHLILARDDKQRAVDANNDATAAGAPHVAAAARPVQPVGAGFGAAAHAPAPVGAGAASQTAAEAAGLSAALISPPAPVAPVAVDPMPPPAPIFPDGAWSVGTLKGAL